MLDQAAQERDVKGNGLEIRVAKAPVGRSLERSLRVAPLLKPGLGEGPCLRRGKPHGFDFDRAVVGPDGDVYHAGSRGIDDLVLAIGEPADGGLQATRAGHGTSSRASRQITARPSSYAASITAAARSSSTLRPVTVNLMTARRACSREGRSESRSRARSAHCTMIGSRGRTDDPRRAARAISAACE